MMFTWLETKLQECIYEKKKKKDLKIERLRDF